MTRHTKLSGALVVLGIALLVTPALFPVQPVLYHDTGEYIDHRQNESQLEQEGYEIIAYENLSDRGQELYVRTLRNDGEYTVPVGSGAPEFAYPTDEDFAEAEERGGHRATTTLGAIVVERPPDADLPPPDEPVERAEYIKERELQEVQEGEEGPNRTGDGASNRTVEEIRRQIARYDGMTTRTGMPPNDSPPVLLRFLSAVAGVLAVGVGGYRWAKP